MGYWWLDRVLPGLLVWLPTFTIGQWIQTRRLHTHVEQVSAGQTRDIQAKLDAQTADLKERS